MPGAGNKDAAPRRRREITEEVATRIIEHIDMERLSEGTHVSAQNLADQLDVSRSPINQALKLLSEKGAVKHEPNRGYFVSGKARTSPEELGLSPADDMREVYFRIAEDRLSGNLPDRVSESALREKYGLTRGQVSTLLNRIAEEGWIERRKGYGWSFSPTLTTPEALDQSYRLRLALEPNALLEPTFSMTQDAIRRWMHLEERLLAGEIDTLSADALHERGVRFHEALAEASGNPYFLDALRRVNRVRRLLSYRSMVDRTRYYGQAEEHLVILEFIMRGRQEEAAEAMRAHLKNVMRNLGRIRSVLEKRP